MQYGVCDMKYSYHLWHRFSIYKYVIVQANYHCIYCIVATDWLLCHRTLIFKICIDMPCITQSMEFSENNLPSTTQAAKVENDTLSVIIQPSVTITMQCMLSESIDIQVAIATSNPCSVSIKHLLASCLPHNKQFCDFLGYMDTCS